jgi:hypothetical protein
MGMGNTFRKIGRGGVFVLAMVLGLSSVCLAEVSAKDMDVIAKAIEFISNGPSGDVKVDIIYDPGNAGSVADANAAATLLGSGVSSGKLKLTGKKAESSSGAKVAYIAKGAEAKAPALNAKGIITVSADPECARSGQCVLSVTSSPKVEIHVSSAASKSAGVEFGSAFRMMITEH